LPGFAGFDELTVQRVQFSADPTDYTTVHSSPVIVLVPNRSEPLFVKPDSSAQAIRVVLGNVLELLTR
jgi:hypothetical protein